MTPIDTVDFSKPYVALGDADPPLEPEASGPDFIEQDGRTYCWSKRLCRYERAWWLDPDIEETATVRRLRATRTPPPNFVKGT